MQSKMKLNLRSLNGRHFFIKPKELKDITSSLDSFLDGQAHMNSKFFATRVMFSPRISSNNPAYRCDDNVQDIEGIINSASEIKNVDRRKRIINLYRGYNYILTHTDINEDTLKELYDILSDGLLDEYSKENMGRYYRNKRVFLMRSEIMFSSFYEETPVNRIDEFMKMYFNFLNENAEMDLTSEYIKSQILHFYFLYIHPYFDVNGRTSRTLAMWYLLNKKAYAYTIFNRGMRHTRHYSDVIRTAKETRDLTPFIMMMLNTVQEELEKEYILLSIASTCGNTLSAAEMQSMLCYLSLRAQKTVEDFAREYNLTQCQGYKNIEEIYNEILMPLIVKDILIPGKESELHEKVLTLRPLDIDPKKVQNLKL